MGLPMLLRVVLTLIIQMSAGDLLWTTAHADDMRICGSVDSDDYKKKGYIDTAIAACDRVIEDKIYSGKNLAKVYLIRGYWYHKAEQNDRAMNNFNKGLDIDPSNYEGYDYRADLWVSMGNTERALADYEQALRLNPKYLSARYSRGKIYQNRGEVEAAREEYEKVLDLPATDRIAEWAQENAKRRLKELDKKQ